MKNKKGERMVERGHRQLGSYRSVGEAEDGHLWRN